MGCPDSYFLLGYYTKTSHSFWNQCQMACFLDMETVFSSQLKPNSMQKHNLFSTLSERQVKHIARFRLCKPTYPSPVCCLKVVSWPDFYLSSHIQVDLQVGEECVS